MREMNNLLDSNINKRKIKLSRGKSIDVNSKSVPMRETVRIILRDGFQYFSTLEQDNLSVGYSMKSTNRYNLI
jgi:hypothetical protein